ncbi:hypothetical protein MSAN_01068800 [Mycena sanguinolenta]|uniref:Ricin B lectin domain-containing protein n=1 Tax=Mycena sanguinolenta TaxID=230812 RepID=A0A8H6YMX3_9AGAR|nr:hypothetical protein MSAN_01068800 [Mycena sanguinolenta]
MFSKVLAFGLGALALVRAAPVFSFQTPMLSCSVNVDASVAPVTSNAIEPGVYKIYNEAFGPAQLRSYTLNTPIYVSYTREEPGPFGLWNVISVGSNEYKIVNAGLSSVALVSQGQIITEPRQGGGDNFAIEPAGEGMFTIQLPDRDRVWTVDASGPRSDVSLKPQDGASEARWKFVKL